MSAREYRAVLPDLTGSADLFACSDCGAVVWRAGIALHDSHHHRVDVLAEQIRALIATAQRHTEMLDTAEQRLDYHAEQLVHLQGGVA